MSAKPISSPNFGFLAVHDALLVKVAALAERYVFEDPNSALIKLRQFAELLAGQTAAYVGIEKQEKDSFLSVLDKLWERKAFNATVSQLFHGLRKAGNDAAHNHGGTARESLYQLQMARKLAVWFHKSFGNAQHFKAGSFVPPPDPAYAEAELATELARLREAAAKAKAEAEQLKSDLETQALLKTQAEEEAKSAFEELETALGLAAESEKHLVAEKQKFEERLKVLQSAQVASGAEKLEATVQQSYTVARQVDLDEAETRVLIDQQLRDAGWEVDSAKLLHGKGVRPAKGRNLAIAEWPTAKGPADYCLFVGLTPVAVVEAKRKKKDVAGSIEQAKRYSRSFAVETDMDSPGGPWERYKIPFLFATNGRPFLRQVAEKSGIWFLDARRTTNHPKPLEAWYTPEGLRKLLDQDIEAAQKRLAQEPMDYLPLRKYQTEAIQAVENQIAEGKENMLVAMATGTGKTRTCIGLVYRLIKSGRFRRVLFLVDRSALGEQAADAFKDLKLESFQSFTDIYDVKELGDIRPEGDTRLHFATVQGMVKRLMYDEGNNAPIHVDAYDCIVVDECHRGYNLDQEMSDAEMEFRSEAEYISKYRRVIDHFDAVRIGLTATPALHTTEIFGPPVYQYSYRQAVIDGFLVDHEPPYQISTKLLEEGMKWEQNEEMKVLDSKTSQLELFKTPDEVSFDVDQFNKNVITENFNKTVCSALAEHIDPTEDGKTVVFCATDNHADMVVRLLTKAFEEEHGAIHDDTVKKITGASDKPSQLIRRFKNEGLPKVAVTVDLLTTGIDVPEITNVVFLRRVKSRILFEQMLGRATRLCPDLYGPGQDKEKFLIFDAVRLYEQLEAVSDMKPVVTKVNITFEQLVAELCGEEAVDSRDQIKDQLLVKLRRKKLTESQVERLLTATGLDREALIQHIVATPADELAEWFRNQEATTSILMEVHEGSTKYVISEHADELLEVERGYGTAAKPGDYLDSFREYILENLNDHPALIVVALRPKDLTRAQLRELRLALDQAGFIESHLRTAWRETTNQDIAASIIGFIRHAALNQPLMAHKDRVAAAMKSVLSSRAWTEPQRKWLERIGKQLEQEIIVDRDSLDSGQFKQKGGYARINKVFNGEIDKILKEIAEAMWQSAA